MLGISNAAESIGFKTLGAKLSFEELCSAPLPYIVHWNMNHFAVVYAINKIKSGYKISVADPASKNLVYSGEEFKRCWISTVDAGEERGVVLLLEPTPDFYTQTGEKVNRKSFIFYLNI
jgi:bacteriocin-processing peptidase. Cysteine peptidase. MEROPS family C39